MKKLLKEIPKSALCTLGGALGSWLIVVITAAIRWAQGLAWTDRTILSVQLSLSFLGLALLGFVGWQLFFQIRRSLRSVKQELLDSRKELADALKHPHRFQDDCTFDSRLGLYRHK